jgi:hypothetical protein
MLFSPVELVERLAAIVPPPRVNQITFRGVLAAHAAWRPLVVPPPRPESPEAALARSARKLRKSAPPKAGTERAGWADLLARVFGEDGFRSPRSGAPMALRCLVLQTGFGTARDDEDPAEPRERDRAPIAAAEGSMTGWCGERTGPAGGASFDG